MTFDADDLFSLNYLTILSFKNLFIDKIIFLFLREIKMTYFFLIISDV